MTQGNIRLLMYKGDGRIGNKLIRWWTGSQYSHCEIQIGQICYSSSIMDGGVRCKSINIDSEHWDAIDLPNHLSDAVLDLFKKTEGSGYSYLDLILDQVFNRSKNSSSRFFCSEWCAWALGLPNPTSYSPRTLADLVKYLLKQGLTFDAKLQ